MKKLLLIQFCINIASLGLSGQDIIPTRIPAGNSEQKDYIRTTPSGCTVITISKGDKVFFGGNDDYINPDSYYWVEKGDSTKFGVIWIGTPDNPQQGVNEKGLAYDSNGLPRFEVNPHNERIPVPGEYHIYCMRIMHECSTVEEAVDWVSKHQRAPYMHDQLHFADKKGDAVIISAGKDGEMVFTRKTPGDGFLVSTNFNVANPANGYGYPCWRYDKATGIMGKLLEKKDFLTINNVTNVLDAVHVEKGSSWTIETMISDLVNGVVYLYYFFQYDKPVVLSVSEELSNPREAGPLSALFPDEVKQEAAKRFMIATKPMRVNRIAGLSWTALIILCLVFLFILPSGKKGLRFWIPAVIVLGPVALLSKLLTLNRGKTSVWRNAVIETTGNLVPLAIATLVSIMIIILKMVSGSFSQELQILFLILPLSTAWIFFHGPLLYPESKSNYCRFLVQRLPQVIVTSLLGTAGIFTVSMPLVNKSVVMSQIIPLSPLIVMTWWAIIAAGSLAGGLIMFFYEYWAVKRGYQAWIIYEGNTGEVITPKWGKIWWWILVSISLLLAGLIIAVKLLQNTPAS